jgi:hypothetical protein
MKEFSTEIEIDAPPEKVWSPSGVRQGVSKTSRKQA